MTFGTKCPFAFVLSTVNREILGIMIIGRWNPRRLRMAGGTIGEELRRSMFWICRAVIICCMTGITCFLGIGINTFVAGSTVFGYRCVGSGQHVVIVVNGE